MFFMWASAEDAPATFEARLNKAYETSSLTPDKTHGRFVWVSKQLGERGVTASPESVRKWFAGLTRPRGNTLEALGEVLGVSVEWLETGKVGGNPATLTAEAQDDVVFPFEDDEIFDLDFEKVEWDHVDTHDRENVAAAGLVSARLMFAGIEHRSRGNRLLIESGRKAREIAVTFLHKVVDRGGTWVAHLPEARSGFEPYTTAFDILMFVLPRGGREPLLFAILGRAAARLGEPGAKITITESVIDGVTKINLMTVSGKSASVSPISDLSALQKIMG